MFHLDIQNLDCKATIRPTLGSSDTLKGIDFMQVPSP